MSQFYHANRQVLTSCMEQSPPRQTDGLSAYTF